MIRADYLINLVLEDISMAVIDCECNNLNQEQKGKKNYKSWQNVAIYL